MTIFAISDNTIDSVKKKRIMTMVLIMIFSLVTWGSLSFFVMKNIDLKIFFISFCLTVVLVTFVVLFSLRFSMKLLIKEMKSIQYIFDNDKLIIKKHDLEQFNLSKDDIQCINKYKDNVINIILNNNKKIIVDKYLDDFDKLIENLNTLSAVNEIDKNSSKIKGILFGFIFLVIISAFFIIKNILFTVLLGILIIICSILYSFNNSMDKKRKKFIIICAILVVVLKIIERML